MASTSQHPTRIGAKACTTPHRTRVGSCGADTLTWCKTMPSLPSFLPSPFACLDAVGVVDDTVPTTASPPNTTQHHPTSPNTTATYLDTGRLIDGAVERRLLRRAELTPAALGLLEQSGVGGLDNRRRLRPHDGGAQLEETAGGDTYGRADESCIRKSGCRSVVSLCYQKMVSIPQL